MNNIKKVNTSKANLFNSNSKILSTKETEGNNYNQKEKEGLATSKSKKEAKDTNNTLNTNKSKKSLVTIGSHHKNHPSTGNNQLKSEKSKHSINHSKQISGVKKEVKEEAKEENLAKNPTEKEIVLKSIQNTEKKENKELNYSNILGSIDNSALNKELLIKNDKNPSILNSFVKINELESSTVSAFNMENKVGQKENNSAVKNINFNITNEINHLEEKEKEIIEIKNNDKDKYEELININKKESLEKVETAQTASFSPSLTTSQSFSSIIESKEYVATTFFSFISENERLNIYGISCKKIRKRILEKYVDYLNSEKSIFMEKETEMKKVSKVFLIDFFTFTTLEIHRKRL